VVKISGNLTWAIIPAEYILWQ